MKTSQFHEQEYVQFWQISGELLQAARDNLSQDVIDGHLDELEGIRINTEQVSLRKRCNALLSQFHVAPATGSTAR